MKNETEADLIAELAQQQIKHSPQKIVRIIRSSSGKIAFLEQGDVNAGLQHIIDKHGQDFVYKGITLHDIPDLLMTAVKQNKQFGTQGRNRIIFSVEFKNKTYLVAIQIGNNGFIVSANPKSKL